jgi:iron complex outermembrane receptor protein
MASRRRVELELLAILACATGAAVFAQESPPPISEPAAEAVKPATQRPAGQAIEEIVVTARKTEENLQDVPVSVTALSAEGLEQTSTFEMRELGLRMPNMTVQHGPAQPTALTFQIRGQVQNDILGTLDPSIGFYDDGVYVARPHGANASFVDVKSVQVLRGPQGTLFGRNTTGGAVLLSTNDPDLESLSGSLSALGGSFGRRKFAGVFNLPVVKETLGLRVVAETLDTNGFAFDETNQRKVGTEAHDLLRAKILYKPLDGLSVLVGGQYIRADFLGYPVQPVFALKPTQARQPGVCCLASLNATVGGVDYDRYVLGDPDRVDYDPGLVPTSKITVKSLTLMPVWDLPWVTVKLIAGLRRNEKAGNRIDIDASPSKIVDTLQANANRQQSYELQFTGTWLTDRLKWAAGAVYFDEKGEERMFTPALTSLDPLGLIQPIVTPGDMDNESVGGYAQATYEFLPKLRISAGIRHTRDEKKLVLRAMMGSMCAVPQDLRDPGTACQATFDDSFGNTSYLAGADYRLLENASVVDALLVYFSVTTGYRAGGQNLRGTSDATLTPFKPETLTQFEAGFKSELFDRRVRFNGAGFHTLYNDVQQTVIVASNSVLPATVVTNAAKAKITGAEIEVAALPPVEGVELGGSVGVTLPRYDEFRDAGGDRSNEKFILVPKLSYALSAAYTREVFGVPWLNRADWSWKSETPYGQGEMRYFRNQGFDLEPVVNQPPTGNLNVRSALTFADRFEVGFYGKNLTDERTFATIVLGGGPDFVTRLYNNPPREFGGDVTYRF